MDHIKGQASKGLEQPDLVVGGVPAYGRGVVTRSLKASPSCLGFISLPAGAPAITVKAAIDLVPI